MQNPLESCQYYSNIFMVFSLQAKVYLSKYLIGCDNRLWRSCLKVLPKVSAPVSS